MGLKQCSRFKCNFRLSWWDVLANTTQAVVLDRWVKDHKLVLNEVISRIVSDLTIKQVALCFSSPLSFEENLREDHILS